MCHEACLLLLQSCSSPFEDRISLCLSKGFANILILGRHCGNTGAIPQIKKQMPGEGWWFPPAGVSQTLEQQVEVSGNVRLCDLRLWICLSKKEHPTCLLSSL